MSANSYEDCTPYENLRLTKKVPAFDFLGEPLTGDVARSFATALE